MYYVENMATERRMLRHLAIAQQRHDSPCIQPYNLLIQGGGTELRPQANDLRQIPRYYS